jgi:glycosyltransferase involved in cell wall biosynthesis
VLQEHPDAELHLVGAGDDVAGLAALADRLGCAGSLVWHGPLTGDALVAAYHDCSVVVLPSLTESESFGITLVEAMACGRPVVGSDVGGIRFVVGDDVEGMLTPPGDPRALARTLVGLLADAGLRTRLGRAGRAAAEQRWNQQRTTTRLLDILRRADRAAVDTGRTG